VLVVKLVGDSKASDIKQLMLQRDPHNGKTWFPSRSVMPNEEHVDAAVRELFAETGLTLTVDDITVLSPKPVRVPLLAAKYHLVYVFSAYVPAPCVNANQRTHAKVEQAVNAQSTIHHVGTYVVPAMVDIDGLSLMPSKTGLVNENQIIKYELLHIGYVAHWQSFRVAMVSRQI
jgi:8-oxo-dGTP pyrophosphatase MutT (NUDIX family)